MLDSMSRKIGMIKSSSILVILTIASKLFSLVREMLIASFYGVSASTDAYFLAGGFVSNTFFAITAALGAVFVPYYTGIKRKRGSKELSNICSSVFSALSIFSFLVVIIVYSLSPYISRLIAPTYSDDSLGEVVLYMRIYALTILFSLLTNMLTSILNAESQYGYGGMGSLIYSITSIGCMVFLKKYIGVAALAISVPLSFMFQLFIISVKIRKLVIIKPTIHVFTKDVKILLMLMLPVLMSNATVELNQLLTRSIASSAADGSVSILSYSNTLFNLVSTIISASLITVFYTEMSVAANDGANKNFVNLVSRGIKVIYICLLPVAIVSMIYANDIVIIVFGRGAFSSKSIILTGKCLRIYSAAFIFDSLRNLLIRAFYAIGNTRIPLINSATSMVITIVLATVLSKHYGIIGIIGAISSSIVITSIIMLCTSRKVLNTVSITQMSTTLLKSLSSGIIAAILLFLFQKLMLGTSPYIRFLCASIIGLTTYIVLLSMLKCSETSAIINMIKSWISYRHTIKEHKK